MLKKCSFIILLMTNGGSINLSAPANNVINNKIIHPAGPARFYYPGIYYLDGTVEGDTNEGFLVYTSADMKNREANNEADIGYALRNGCLWYCKFFGSPGFFHNNRFYMAYIANEVIPIAESKTPPLGFLRKRLNNLWQLR